MRKSILFLGVAMVLKATSAATQTNLTQNPPARAVASESIKQGESLLYIVPREALGTNGWGTLAAPGDQELSDEQQRPRSVAIFYRIEDLQSKTTAQPFASFFGNDAVIIPANGSDSLFKLLSIHVPEGPGPLTPIRIDPGRYHLEALASEPAWPDDPAPKRILLKWAEWWQSETNATPVVLVMVAF